MKKLITAVVSLFIILSSGACNSSGEQKTMSETRTVEETSTGYQVGDRLPNEQVCMVNNAYMGKPQIPVPVNGKTYYGCCQMCVGKLNEQESARTAVDAFSGNKVDKSEAYIILADPQGKVAYFESEQNYQKFSEGTK